MENSLVVLHLYTHVNNNWYVQAVYSSYLQGKNDRNSNSRITARQQ